MKKVTAAQVATPVETAGKGPRMRTPGGEHFTDRDLARSAAHSTARSEPSSSPPQPTPSGSRPRAPRAPGHPLRS